MAKFSNVEIEPAGYFSNEANEPAYKCKRAANAQMHKLAQTFAISSGDKGPTPKMLHTKSQGHRPSGSGEEDFKGVLPYMGVAAILVK